MLRFAVVMLSIWATGFPPYALAQLPFINSQTLPKAGDTLFYQVDELPRRVSISAPGTDQVWNFANLLGPYLQYQIIQSSDNEAIMQVSNDRGIKQKISVNQKGLVWNGSTRLMVGKTPVSQPWWSDSGLPLPSLELTYLDDKDYSALYQTSMPVAESPTGWKNSLPTGIDSIRISILIDRSISVDALGLLFLGSGYRQDVQRLRVEDQINKKLWVKKPAGDWQDVTSLVRLDDFLSEKSLSYHFVSLETGGNICSVFLDQNGTPVKVSFLTPHEQAKYYKTAVAGQQVHAYPNPALSIVRFKFMDLPPGNYSIKFYDVFMRGLFENRYNIMGEETVEININQLDKGPYLYSLVDENGKKIVTKRLIVIKP
jgi:hypothetical protein